MNLHIIGYIRINYSGFLWKNTFWIANSVDYDRTSNAVWTETGLTGRDLSYIRVKTYTETYAK